MDVANKIKNHLIEKTKISKIVKLPKDCFFIEKIKSKAIKKITKVLDLEEKNRNQSRFSFLEGVLEGLLLVRSEMKLVQIGSNDGKINDPIYKFLMTNKKYTNVLLIEPQDEIIPFLVKNYHNHPQVKIFNGAIGSGNELTLFRIKPSLWKFFNPPYLKDAPRYRVASGITSSDKSKVLSAINSSFEVDLLPKDIIEKVRVPCRQLESLLEEYSFGRDIDVIQVDAEGADDEVIYSCNIETIKPLVINYEYIHLSIKKIMI